MMQTDHNGKPVKKSYGKNVRIPEKTYDVIRKYTFRKGYRMAAFYETAVLEKMQREKSAIKE